MQDASSNTRDGARCTGEARQSAFNRASIDAGQQNSPAQRKCLTQRLRQKAGRKVAYVEHKDGEGAAQRACQGRQPPLLLASLVEPAQKAAHRQRQSTRKAATTQAERKPQAASKTRATANPALTNQPNHEAATRSACRSAERYRPAPVELDHARGPPAHDPRGLHAVRAAKDPHRARVHLASQASNEQNASAQY